MVETLGRDEEWLVWVPCLEGTGPEVLGLDGWRSSLKCVPFNSCEYRSLFRRDGERTTRNCKSGLVSLCLIGEDVLTWPFNLGVYFFLQQDRLTNHSGDIEQVNVYKYRSNSVTDRLIKPDVWGVCTLRLLSGFQNYKSFDPEEEPFNKATRPYN